MKNVLILMALIAYSFSTYANNVQITNLVKTGITIEFDLTWENSWRINSQYHDAVWIFIKQAPNGGPSWQHVNINTASATNYSTVIPADDVGFFVRRSINDNGTASTTVTATLSGLTGAFQDIKVMGIEMVFVPSGPFYIGDGVSGGRAARGDDVTQPYHVYSNSQLVCGTSNLNLQYSSGTCTNIPVSSPRGYNEFYCMKYTITQSQYVDFLNCLPRNQQENRINSDIVNNIVTNRYVLCDNTISTKGNIIRCESSIGAGNITFYCDQNDNGIPNEVDDGMSRSCNYLKTTDWMAYLDWCGLRPFTFLEAEKAARGSAIPIQYEKSWGSTVYNSNGALINAGTETEKWANSTIDAGISTYSDDVIRVGCNAPSSGATRELSNASFYGIIDLGNNPGDYYISPDHISTYTEIEGDGTLDSNGDADVATWPYLDPASPQKTKITTLGFGFSQMIQIVTNAVLERGGGRGVRSNL